MSIIFNHLKIARVLLLGSVVIEYGNGGSVGIICIDAAGLK